ncbi:MAG: hypothetical protein WCP91_03595 [Candidatus Berkelbacteria bacterium]
MSDMTDAGSSQPSLAILMRVGSSPTGAVAPTPVSDYELIIIAGTEENWLVHRSKDGVKQFLEQALGEDHIVASEGVYEITVPKGMRGAWVGSRGRVSSFICEYLGAEAVISEDETWVIHGTRTRQNQRLSLIDRRRAVYRSIVCPDVREHIADPQTIHDRIVTLMNHETSSRVNQFMEACGWFFSAGTVGGIGVMIVVEQGLFKQYQTCCFNPALPPSKHEDRTPAAITKAANIISQTMDADELETRWTERLEQLKWRKPKAPPK